MIRKAFYMELELGCREEYIRAHNPIPDELAAALKECGVANYSIFIHPVNDLLFGCLEAESEEKLARLADYECCRSW